MKRTHLLDQQTGRLRTITTHGNGVRVRRRATELELDDDAAAAERSAERPSRALERREEHLRLAAQKRARLRARLHGKGGAAVMREALAALIDRGLLDHMGED